MAGIKTPSFGKPAQISAAIGIPTPGQAGSMKAKGPTGIPAGPTPKAPVVTPRTVQPLALPEQRKAFHTNTAVPRGHLVGGRLRTGR